MGINPTVVVLKFFDLIDLIRKIPSFFGKLSEFIEKERADMKKMEAALEEKGIKTDGSSPFLM
jgi:hypothetical protein